MPLVRSRFWFSLIVTALLLISAALLLVLAFCLRKQTPLDVRVRVQPDPLSRYDDHAGHFPRAALVQITNLSEGTAWFLGPSTYATEQRIDGKWESRASFASSADGKRQWVPLRALGSKPILVGPIAENATELRVSIPFTTERTGLPFLTETIAPTNAHWIVSPTVVIVKRGADYMPEPKPGSTQDEQVLSLE